MKRLLALTLLAILLEPAWSLAQRRTTTYGSGTLSCGRWTADEKNADLHPVHLMWVLGFVSSSTAFFNLKDTDADGIDAWMNKYCAETPLQSVAGAAAKLVSALTVK